MLDLKHMESEHMTIELSRAEKDVLKRIALQGNKTSYDLFRKDRVAASSTVWKTLRKLEKLGFIEETKAEKFERIPSKTKRWYGLTFRGLVYALKLEGVRLHQIQNRNDLITSWTRKLSEIDESTLKLAQTLGAKKGAQKKFEYFMLDHMTQNPEKIEAFLKHFDLEYSNDVLIFGDLVFFFSGEYLTPNLNRRFRRQLEKMREKIPDGWFQVPE